MAWSNAAAADKPPSRGPMISSFTHTENFPSLGSAPPSVRTSGGTAQQPSASAPAAPTIPARAPDNHLGYFVTGSKKGGFPVAVEKRACGKKVTVIRNISGDRGALLSALKKKMGCGGVMNEDGSVEVQGERQPAVEKFLTEMKCLKSVSKAKKENAAPKKVEKTVALTKLDNKFAEANNLSKGKPVALEIASVSEQAAKKMKPAEIKMHLKEAGLSTQGNKKELLARLLEQIKLLN